MNEEDYKRTSSQRRTLPQSDLDFNLIITDPVLGRSSVDLSEFATEEIQEIVPPGTLVYTPDGKQSFVTEQPTRVIKKRNLWELLQFYTRDLRLANLNMQELIYIRHYHGLAGDYLQKNFIGCFIICLRRVADVTESSQSKNGFLRRRQSTKTSEQTFQELNPPKSKIFGGQQKNQYGGSN